MQPNLKKFNSESLKSLNSRKSTHVLLAYAYCTIYPPKNGGETEKRLFKAQAASRESNDGRKSYRECTYKYMTLVLLCLKMGAS